MRRIRRLALAPVIAVLLLAVLAPAASASLQPYEWRDGDLTGSCTNGWKSGGYVWSVQSILYAEGLLSVSQVDGLWGPVTASAAKTWQSRHGLTADGCFGYNSWNKAQHGYHNINVGGETVRFYHLTQTGFTNPFRHRYEEKNRNNGRLVAYTWGNGYCWSVDPPGTRSWTNVAGSGQSC